MGEQNGEQPRRELSPWQQFFIVGCAAVGVVVATSQRGNWAGAYGALITIAIVAVFMFFKHRK
jgi:hypothetical protein